MSIDVMDVVRVTKHRCCFGYPQGTELTVIKKENDDTFLCLPVRDTYRGTINQNGKWHCPNCLEKMEEKKKNDTQIG